MPGVLTHTGSTMKRLRVARLGLAAGCLLAAVVSAGAQVAPPHDGLVTPLLASGDAAHRAGLLAAVTPHASLVDALIEAGTRERVSGETSRAGVAFDAAVFLARRLEGSSRWRGARRRAVTPGAAATSPRPSGCCARA
jgi:hypothetical protein